MYQPPKPKSRFVTGLGLAMIVLSAKILLISFLVMFNIMMQDVVTHDHTINPELDNVFFYFRIGFVVNLSLAICFLSAAIGLFYRKNWARVLVMGLFFFIIGAMLCGIAAEWIWLDNTGGLIVLKVFSILIAGGITALLLWFLKKLNEDEIVLEFIESANGSSTNDFSL